MTVPAWTDEFEQLRPHLLAVGYRLTGTYADAEDIVQDAWLRRHGTAEQILDLRAWLTTVVSRLGLDKLRSAARRHETYVGQWLPEPVVTGPAGADPLAAVVAGVAGVMYTPIVPPNYNIGMDFLVLSFVVVVVGGMGSVSGAVLAGFLLGILQSFAAMNEVKNIIPGIDQVIIYLVAVVVLLTMPRGLLGRKGVMES